MWTLQMLVRLRKSKSKRLVLLLSSRPIFPRVLVYLCMNKKVRQEISSKGGKARSASLTPARRTEIARAAALARYAKRGATTRRVVLPPLLPDPD